MANTYGQVEASTIGRLIAFEAHELENQQALRGVVDAAQLRWSTVPRDTHPALKALDAFAEGVESFLAGLVEESQL